MVKLALCFSGDPRTFETCFHSIKSNLLDKYDCDIFISTYEVNNEISNTILNLYKPKVCEFKNKNEVSKQVMEYIQTLNLVKSLPTPPIQMPAMDNKDYYEIEDAFINYNAYTDKFVYVKLYLNAVCQFYGINDVSKLCKNYMEHNNVCYDYIFRLRLDDAIYGNFTIYELEENEILVNKLEYYTNSVKLHDHFFMAKPATFFNISHIYDNLPNIIHFINTNRCWLPSSGYQETILFIQTILYNIKIKTSDPTFIIRKT